jgi:hypothetical protein
LEDWLNEFDPAEHEKNYDPPDSIERLLAREVAKLEGKPDPFGTNGMSETERRACDWADWHKKERRRGEEQLSDTPNAGDSEQPNPNRENKL